MTQTELNQAIAAATGETLAEIAHRGFSLWKPSPSDEEEEVSVESIIETSSPQPSE